MTLLSTTTLASPGTIDVQNISQSYNDLRLVLVCRGTVAAAVETLGLRFNNDSGSNYQYQQLAGQGAAASAVGNTTQDHIVIGASAGNTSTANYYSQTVIDILAYVAANVTRQCVSYNYYTQGSGAATQGRFDHGGTWQSTSAINRVTIYGVTTANLATGSFLRIYGIL